MIAALFLVFQLTVMPWPEAYAAQDLDISSTDSEINDLPEEEAEEPSTEETDEEGVLPPVGKKRAFFTGTGGGHFFHMREKFWKNTPQGGGSNDKRGLD